MKIIDDIVETFNIDERENSDPANLENLEHNSSLDTINFDELNKLKVSESALKSAPNDIPEYQDESNGESINASDLKVYFIR